MALTGSLAPDVRDLLIGLTTVTDDEGWLMWSPDELATTIYPYAPPKRRVRDLERRAKVLEDAGLLVIKECRCAELPTLKEHHAVKGGDKTRGVWGWHQRHQSVGLLRSPTEESVSDSVSVTASSSVSDSVSVTASSRAPARGPSGPAGGGEATCFECGRPTSIHAADCPLLRHPHLSEVVA
jgi:hypothetical protein